MAKRMKLIVIVSLFCSTLALPKTSRRHLDPKIVGGSEAVPNEFPFMLSMQYRSGNNYVHRCGASIINENWAMSASHCTENANPSFTRMAAGLHSQGTASGSEQYSLVDAFVMHPQYDTVTLENDIVLIKLSTPLVFNSVVSRISLPAQNQDTSAGTSVTVVGWGNLESGNTTRPDKLQKVTVPTVSDATCRESYGPTDMFDSFICAGLAEGGLDACNGDSGGPLFTSDSFTQVGIVSWGQGCALPNFYGVYTEVSYFVDWINSIVGQNELN